LPALKVKPDPSLKSCLSPSIDPQRKLPEDSTTFVHEQSKLPDAHPSFVDPNDNVSPINHGLNGRASDEINTSRLTSESTTQALEVPGSLQHPNASQEATRKLHLLIGITGCISILKNVFLIIEKLFELYTPEKLEIQVVLTKSAEWFLTDKLYKFENLGVKVWFSDDGEAYYMESKVEQQMSGEAKPAFQMYLAPELQKWTDVLLLAPLSANTLAKLINGLADNLLTDILHTWPTPQPQTHSVAHNIDNTVLTNNIISPKPIVAALALTNSMYSHPITKRQLALLQDTYPNVSILKPVEKCVDVDGNIAMGGMRSWREVVDFVLKKLGEPEDDEDDEDDDDTQNDEDDITDSNSATPRSRLNTLTRKELQEHEELASKNAILNTG
ncbi:flavo protein, partial [Suhomyces tanzawaensis NRRL Y-17324]